MSDDTTPPTEPIDSVGQPDGAPDPDHDPTNGRWFESRVADTLERWGYRTARNERLFGLETDIIARRDTLRGEPDDFVVVECKDWHKTPVHRDAVEDIALRAALARAMPVLAVAQTITPGAWERAQLLDVRIITASELHNEQLPPLTKRRPPAGTLRARQEAPISNMRDRLPMLLQRDSDLDIESPVLYRSGRGPCYVSDRTGNDAYISAWDSDYDFD